MSAPRIKDGLVVWPRRAGKKHADRQTAIAVAALGVHMHFIGPNGSCCTGATTCKGSVPVEEFDVIQEEPEARSEKEVQGPTFKVSEISEGISPSKHDFTLDNLD